MSKRKNLIPVVLLLTVVPMIVHMREVATGLSQYNWFSQIDTVTDFFLYYKSLAITWIAAVMCVILVYRYLVKREGFRFCLGLTPLLVYAALTVLSTICSPYQYFSFHGAFEVYETLWVVLGYCVILFYAYQVIQTKEDVDEILKWLTVGLGAMLIIGILQAAGHDLFGTDFGKMLITGSRAQADEIGTAFESGRVYLTVYNPNYVASYFALMIPMEIALWMKSKRLAYRVLYTVMLAASVICLLASGNRSGLAAFLATIVLAVILFYKQLVRAWKMVLPFFAAALVLIGVFFSVNPLIWEKFSSLLKAKTPEEHMITEMVTGDEDVAITYFGQTLHLAYELNAENNLKVFMQDDAGEDVEAVFDGDNYLYVMKDERFTGITIQAVRFEDEIALCVNADARDWYFKKGEDGSYYFYNAFGRWDKAAVIPRVSSSFLERVLEERGSIWSKTIPMLKHRLLLGSGADTYTVTYPQNDYVDKTYKGTLTQIDVKPHCFYLQVATQSGILALLALLVLYGWYLATGFRLYRKADFTDGLELTGAGLMLATFTYLVISIVNDSTVAVAPIFWVMLGMGVAVNQMIKKKGEKGCA